MPAPDVSERSIADLMSLRGRIAAVTGAGRGAGLAIAHRLAEAGAAVAVCDIDPDAVVGAVAELESYGVPTLGVTIDIGSTESVTQGIARVRADLGALDILVNNAGILTQALICEVTDEFWERMLGVNLGGPMRCSRAAYPHLVESGWGSVIVNVLSTAAFSVRAKGNGPYSSSKFGLNGLTRAMALQFGDAGIRVLGVAPTLIDTPGLANIAGTVDLAAGAIASFGSSLPLGRAAVADDIARAVLFCVSDMAMMMTGSTVFVDGGALI